MQAYADAIKAVVRTNDVVIDIGTGTGILSFLAARYGAGKVIGFDRTRIVDYADEIKKLNFPDAPITFMQKDVLGEDLPHVQADVAICELFGNFGIDENVIKVLSKVRNDLLAPNGRLIPETLELLVAPVQCTSAYREVANWKHAEYGIDFSPLQRLAYNAVYQIISEPVRLLSEPQTIATIDFYTVETLAKELTGSFTFGRDGTLHGLAGWFRSQLAPGRILDCGPDAPHTHWGQILFPIGDPLNIKKDGQITMMFKETADNTSSLWQWSGEIRPTKITRKPIEFSFSASRRFHDD